jgi:hypothetical protein
MPCRNAKPINPTRTMKARSGTTQFGMVSSIQAASVGGLFHLVTQVPQRDPLSAEPGACHPCPPIRALVAWVSLARPWRSRWFTSGVGVRADLADGFGHFAFDPKGDGTLTQKQAGPKGVMAVTRGAVQWAITDAARQTRGMTRFASKLGKVRSSRQIEKYALSRRVCDCDLQYKHR